MAIPPMISFPTLPPATRLEIFEAVVEHVPDCVLLATVAPHPMTTLQVIYSNAAFSTMTGYAPEEIIGASLTLLSGPGTNSETMIQIATAAALDIAMSAEVCLYRADHTPVWVMFTLVPITDAARALRCLAIALRDITAQKAQQEASHATTGELTRSNRALQEFASVASHDLQEPLRKIMAFGDFLAEHSGAALDDEGRDYLARMRNAAGRMQTLINDLLTFARLTAYAAPFVPVDLAQVVRTVIVDLDAQITRTGGCVTVGDLTMLDADPRQMRMLFQNLISNALKYARRDVPPCVTIDGRAIVRPTTENGRKVDAPWYEVTVSDNGIGFDPQFAEKIFAIFQRLHRRTDYEGTGIGLAVCREIVAYHGGIITAIGRPGEGATFVIELPLQTDREGAM